MSTQTEAEHAALDSMTQERDALQAQLSSLSDDIDYVWGWLPNRSTILQLECERRLRKFAIDWKQARQEEK